jgi:dienelactone hydrolase
MPTPDRDPTQRDALEDFDARELTFLGQTKRVFVAGSGPAVIVMAEMPGIYPLVSRFARRVRDAGFTVWMPVRRRRRGAA